MLRDQWNLLPVNVRFRTIARATCLIVGSVLLPVLPAQTVPQEHRDFFEKRIRPIFVSKCQGCHNAKSRTAGLNLATGAGFRKGAVTGPIVDTKDLENSRLLQVVSYQEPLKMPPTGKLSDGEISALRDWVKVGAPWPVSESEQAIVDVPKRTEYSAKQKEFWSFRPLRPVAL